MNPQDLVKADITLGNVDKGPLQRYLWLIIGIVIGAAVLVISVVWYVRSTASGSGSGGSSGTYPAIITPRNTVMSTSTAELILNMLNDVNDTGIDYSVISRRDILK